MICAKYSSSLPSLGLHRTVHAGAVGVVVVIDVHQVGGDGVVAPRLVGGRLVRLVRGIGDVEGVVGVGLAVLVALAEDEFAVLTLQEEVGEVLLGGRHRRGRASVEGEIAGIHDGLAGLDALGVIGVRIGGFHVGELLLHGFVVGRDRLLVPVLADGCGVEGDAGLKSEGGPPGGAVFPVLAGFGQQRGGLVELRDHEIPGLLLGAARDIEPFVLVAVIILVERFGDDGHAAVAPYHREIAVCAGEDRFAEHSVARSLVDGVLLQGHVHQLDEVVDRTYLRVVPETGHVDVVVGALGVGGQGRVHVLGVERIHRDGGVHIGEKLLQTGLARSHVRLGHSGEVSLQAVEQLVAGAQAEAEDDGQGIFEYLFHFSVCLEAEAESDNIGPEERGAAGAAP